MRAENRRRKDGWREEGGEGGTLCPLFRMEVCVGQVFLSAGIEGWGDRHGRTPGDPQT